MRYPFLPCRVNVLPYPPSVQLRLLVRLHHRVTFCADMMKKWVTDFSLVSFTVPSTAFSFSCIYFSLRLGGPCRPTLPTLTMTPTLCWFLRQKIIHLQIICAEETPHLPKYRHYVQPSPKCWYFWQVVKNQGRVNWEDVAWRCSKSAGPCSSCLLHSLCHSRKAQLEKAEWRRIAAWIPHYAGLLKDYPGLSFVCVSGGGWIHGAPGANPRDLRDNVPPKCCGISVVSGGSANKYKHAQVSFLFSIQSGSH